MEDQFVEQCSLRLGYRFQDKALLKKAFTHSSIASSRVDSNERMEFLGDAVLGLVICEALFCAYDDFQEGELTKIKSAVVSRRMCAEVADEIGISEMLYLGKGFERQELPRSLAAAALESVIGAIYLDGGLEPAKQFILRHMQPKITAVVDEQHSQNYKSILQQALQRDWNAAPTYELLDEKGPDHAKAFEVCVECNGRRFEGRWGNNKKDAEQLAAKAALEELGLLSSEADEEEDFASMDEVDRTSSG